MNDGSGNRRRLGDCGAGREAWGRMISHGCADIAIAGALGPATWSAASRTATALRAE
jgi:hypothetical protein